MDFWANFYCYNLDLGILYELSSCYMALFPIFAVFIALSISVENSCEIDGLRSPSFVDLNFDFRGDKM